MVQFNWQRLPGHRSLKGRAGHSATLVGKKIYVFGGRNGNIFHNDVWGFDMETEQWQLLQAHASISARAYHTATLIGDELWIIGGSDRLTMYGEVHVFNIKTLEWKTPATKGDLAGRLIATHAAVLHPLHSSAILVYGGYGGVDSWRSDLSVFHTDTLEWELLNPKGPSPSARGYHTMTCVGHNVVLYGGKSEHGIVSVDDNLGVYDSATNKWSDRVEIKGTAPLQRSNHAATLIGGSLIVIHGGRNGSERLRDTSVLSVSSGYLGQVRLTWHVFPQEPIAKPRGRKRTGDAAAEALSSSNPGGRAAHSLIANGEDLYLFGGYGGSGVTFDDLHVLRQFSEVTGLIGIEEIPLARKSNRRFSFPVEELGPGPGPGPIEGWRSTKKPRRRTTGTLDYNMDANGRDDDVAPCFPVPELSETPPLEKDFLKVKEQVKELVTKSRADGTERLNELEVHRREVASLQQTVSTLTSEIRAMSVGATDVRERNAVLEHNLEVHRQQVSTLNEKLERLTAENASLKSGLQVLETQKSDKTRERSDMISKLSSLEERYVERDRELSKTLQMLGTAETKVSEMSRLLEEARKEKKAATAECSEHRMKAHKMEVELRNLEQARENHEKEKSSLHNQLADSKSKLERVAGELVAVKDSSRTLQETVERLAKQLERENTRADALERDRDELRRANTALSTEISQITSSRESAEAAAELVRSELRTARVLLDRSETENGRLQEAAENAREHFATQHATMRKYEEDAKALKDENERWKKLVSEMEEFEQAQARTFQNHVERIRIARQM